MVLLAEPVTRTNTDMPLANTAGTAQRRALIPLEVLFGSPQNLNPQLSPDGASLAYAAPDERGMLQVWVRGLESGDDRPARMVTADRKRGIRTFSWAYDNVHLLYLQDRDGDENWHVYAVDTSGQSETRDLTPFDGVQAQIVALEPGVPGQALVALNRTDRRRHDVYRIDLRSGALMLEAENPGGVIQWLADASLAVRCAIATTADGGKDVLTRGGADRTWERAAHWPQDDDGRLVGLSAAATTLYYVSSAGANAQRLIARDLSTGAEDVLAEDPQYDVAEVLFHPGTRRPEAVAFHRQALEWRALDGATEAHLAALVERVQGQLTVVSRDARNERWVVCGAAPDGPNRFYLYDSADRVVRFLFSHRPALEDVALAPSEPITFTACDGLTLHGYLTLPRDVRPVGLPTVVLVHGGPWERDGWRFDPAVQLFADRGYAVLQVNFRGSAGYGKEFLHAGDREWGAKMETDLVDGVEWLVARGVADPARVGIMGASYGGYAALAGLAFHPETFAAGVSVVGPSNLVSLLRSIPAYWAPIRAMFARRIGDPETETDFLESRSPLFAAERMRAPLLVCQGANDPRVPRAESEQMVEALRAVGGEVEYCLYEDEGHGLMRPANRLDFFRRVEAFFARHLAPTREG